MSSESLFFGECANLVRASISPSLFPDSPYIALEHIDQGMLSLNGHAFGRDAGSQKTKFSKGDILFGKLRPYFRKAVIAPFDGMCSTDIWVVRPKLGIDRNFLFYWMASEEFVNHATDTSEGTRMPRAKWDIVSKFEILERSIDEQRAIGNLLRVLDDRIALLRETNATLEAIAQAIFKSWFVDFDPVHAKAEGRLPEGMDKETAALFPDGFEESALGLIPRGWKSGQIVNHCILNDRSWKTDTLPEYVNYVDLANTKNGDLLSIQTFRAKDVPSRARRVLRAGDTIIGTVRPANRSFALIGSNIPQLTGSTGFAVLSPKEAFLREFVYQAATSEANFERLAHLADGAAYPAVRPDVVTESDCIVPDRPALEAFHEITVEVVDQQIANRLLIQTLTALRDTLLPRLISGKLRLPECQNGIEQTTA